MSTRIFLTLMRMISTGSKSPGGRPDGPILGLGLHFKKAPLDLMAEGSWAPYLVLPDLAHGDFSIEVRYYSRPANR